VSALRLQHDWFFHMLGGGTWPFEIAGLIHLGIAPELAWILGGGSDFRIIHRK
jgi:hypothetical protein